MLSKQSLKLIVIVITSPVLINLLLFEKVWDKRIAANLYIMKAEPRQHLRKREGTGDFSLTRLSTTTTVNSRHITFDSPLLFYRTMSTLINYS